MIDAAAVLGCALAPGGVAPPSLVARVEHGVALWREGRVRKVIFTGGPTRPGPTEAAAALALARGMGLPDDAALFEDRSMTTFENMVEIDRVMKQHGLRTVLIVTEPWHLPRAMMLARYVGLDARPSASRSASEGDRRATARWVYRESVRRVVEGALCALRVRDRFFKGRAC